jgi:hypothetical protein
MMGYNVDYLVLLNNNDQGHQMGRQIKERFGFGDEKIVSVSRKPNYATEDLMTFEDFDSYVLKGEASDDQAVLNSEYLQDNEMNRILVARRFYDTVQKRADEIVLSAPTVAAFQKLFEKIISGFNAIPDMEEELEKIEKDTEETPQAQAKLKRRSLFPFLNKQKEVKT